MKGLQKSKWILLPNPDVLQIYLVLQEVGDLFQSTHKGMCYFKSGLKSLPMHVAS